MADSEVPKLVRAMDDHEIRLNCLLAAVGATTYMRGRMTDPITVAQEFYDWVKNDQRPEPMRVQFGGRPAPVTEGFESGIEPPTSEAQRAAEQSGGDLIDVGPQRAARPRS